MNSPLVSIILPTYNGKQYLDFSVQSIIDQTYRNWELIIVDDASTDSTPQLIQKWTQADSRIKTVRHTTNKRIPGGLNTGFNAANGRYITWTSDDNLYRPHAIQTMVDYLQANPTVDLVYTDYSLMNENGQLLQQVSVEEPEMITQKNIVRACFMYKREVHQQMNGYDETLFLVEDYDFWLRASKRFKLAPIHIDCYLYREHEQSLTAQRQHDIMLKREEVMLKHLPTLVWATRHQLAQGYVTVADSAFSRRDWAKGARVLLQATRRQPITVIRHYIRQIVPRSLRLQVLRRLGRA